MEFRKRATPQTADNPAAAAEKATRHAGRLFDRDTLVNSLEQEVKAALRSELEVLIRERLEGILQRDLPRIVEETYRTHRQARRS